MVFILTMGQIAASAVDDVDTNGAAREVCRVKFNVRQPQTVNNDVMISDDSASFGSVTSRNFDNSIGTVRRCDYLVRQW